MVDIQTVEALQLRAPGTSVQDRNFVIEGMRTDYLFPKVLDPGKRQLLKESLLSINCLIPSIKTLYENLKHLGAGAKVIKELVLGDKCRRQTLHVTLKKLWTLTDSTWIQFSEGMKKVAVTISSDESWGLYYKQLWIGALRNFADLGARMPLEEKYGTKYEPERIINQQYVFA